MKRKTWQTNIKCWFLLTQEPLFSADRPALLASLIFGLLASHWTFSILSFLLFAINHFCCCSSIHYLSSRSVAFPFRWRFACLRDISLLLKGDGGVDSGIPTTILGANCGSNSVCLSVCLFVSLFGFLFFFLAVYCCRPCASISISSNDRVFDTFLIEYSI